MLGNASAAGVLPGGETAGPRGNTANGLINFLGVVPKSYLPNYREFYEKRHFASGAGCAATEIALPGVRGGEAVPFGTQLLFQAADLPGFVLAVEICEDAWVPLPPSTHAAMAGATVIANLSGSPITVGRAVDRELLCRSA